MKLMEFQQEDQYMHYETHRRRDKGEENLFKKIMTKTFQVWGKKRTYRFKKYHIY